VDMKTPGITVRPLVLANGHAHFNEVFFEDVRVPKANLVGPQNEGWKVAITTLMFERSIAGGGNYKEQVLRLATVATQLRLNGQPAWEQSWVRQKLTQLLIECECLKYTRLRTFTRQLKGLPPGPEGSMLKLTGSELGVRIAHLASELLGANAVVNEPMDSVPDAPRWFNRVLSARQYTIAGGTSEIQHNIIGERVLGLPKG
jgi:alkylation response protein AidB-like acyl-CoA dehydrogenase